MSNDDFRKAEAALPAAIAKYLTTKNEHRESERMLMEANKAVASLKEKITQAKNDLNELNRKSEVMAGLWTKAKRERDEAFEAYKMLDSEDSRKRAAAKYEVIDLVMSSDDEDDEKEKVHKEEEEHPSPERTPSVTERVRTTCAMSGVESPPASLASAKVSILPTNVASKPSAEETQQHSPSLRAVVPAVATATTSSSQPHTHPPLFHSWGGDLQLACGRRREWLNNNLPILKKKHNIFAKFTHQSFSFGYSTETGLTISHLVLKHVQNALPTKDDPGPLQPLMFYVLLNEEEYGNKLASMDTAVPVFLDLQGRDGNNHLYYAGHWKVMPWMTERFPKGRPLHYRSYGRCMKIELVRVSLDYSLAATLG